MNPDQVALVVAVAANEVMGNRGALPWHLPADMLFFKQRTMGQPIIMGRRTHEALSKALPGRLNIVITSQSNYLAPGCSLAGNLIDALSLAAGANPIYIIGGAEVFKQALNEKLAHTVHLTRVHATVQGDVVWPGLDASWQLAEETHHPADTQNAYSMSFQRWVRTS